MGGTRIHLGRLGAAVGTCAVMGMLAVTAALRAQTTAPAGTQPSPVTAPKAMAYYEAACLRCHGPEGSFYGPELGKKLTDAGLIHVIDEMARGPANDPLDAAGLAAQTAFHRAIMAGAPFVSVTAMGAGEISGEVSAESKVTVSLGGAAKPTATEVKESTWKAAIPRDARLADITVTAEKGNKKTELPLSSPVLYSHTAPIPDPAKR